jgi:hypothetical protein
MKDRKVRDEGLTDRSERPTSHTLFAPLEAKKEREERRLRQRRRSR